MRRRSLDSATQLRPHARIIPEHADMSRISVSIVVVPGRAHRHASAVTVQRHRMAEVVQVDDPINISTHLLPQEPRLGLE
jgi:hypothetical protein